MSGSTSPIETLARQQLDRRLERIRKATPAFRPPEDGWIRVIRTALGMTQSHLAERMGVSRQAVSQLEQRESDGSATLAALEQAADAMDCELVHALVPRRSIVETLEGRALDIARRMTGSVRHTMKLEDQEPDSDLDERTRELARALLSSPRRLWSVPDGE